MISYIYFVGWLIKITISHMCVNISPYNDIIRKYTLLFQIHVQSMTYDNVYEYFVQYSCAQNVYANTY